MFLALLAGGQIIKRIVRKTLGLSGSNGLAIFDFDFSKTSKSEVKSEFIQSINSAELGREIKDLIIAEKIRCFQLNNRIANNVKPRLSSYKRLMKLILTVALVVILIIYILFAISKNV